MDKKTSAKKPVDKYPGVAVDKADDDKVNPCLVRQDTKILNNNPHSKGL